MGATARDPVALGLAKSLAQPGGNVTGTNFFNGLSEKRLQLLKLAFPGVQRVAVLGNPSTVNTASEMPKAEMAAAQLGVRLVPFMASTPAELRTFTPSALSGSDGLLVIAEALFNYNRATIIDVASMARVPAFIRSVNMPMLEGSSPMGPMYLSISAKLPSTLIVFFAVPIQPIFPSTYRRNSISSSTSGLPERLD
jgi:putative ABC transport system substrate-binding protein